MLEEVPDEVPEELIPPELDVGESEEDTREDEVPSEEDVPEEMADEEVTLPEEPPDDDVSEEEDSDVELSAADELIGPIVLSSNKVISFSSNRSVLVAVFRESARALSLLGFTISPEPQDTMVNGIILSRIATIKTPAETTIRFFCTPNTLCSSHIPGLVSERIPTARFPISLLVKIYTKMRKSAQNP